MAQALLPENASIMIFVSVDPFALKRLFFFVLGVIGFSSVSSFGQSLLLSVKSTPYDKQMRRIQPVLMAEGGRDIQGLSLGMVNYWMGDLRSIPYGFTRVWKTPAETVAGGPADCKAKAVALYEKMRSHGAKNVRLVIGKRVATSRRTHAWLEWATETGTYVLDPTINWTAYQGNEVGRRCYLPLYVFEGSDKFQAIPITIVAQN